MLPQSKHLLRLGISVQIGWGKRLLWVLMVLQLTLAAKPFYKEMQEMSLCPFTVCLTGRPNYIGFCAFSHNEVAYLFVN